MKLYSYKIACITAAGSMHLNSLVKERSISLITIFSSFLSPLL